jgi:hypothetical protein
VNIRCCIFFRILFAWKDVAIAGHFCWLKFDAERQRERIHVWSGHSGSKLDFQEGITVWWTRGRELRNGCKDLQLLDKSFELPSEIAPTPTSHPKTSPRHNSVNI